MAPCCEQFYPCRFCHDEEKWDAQPDAKKKHKMNRHEVTTVRCRACQTVQPHHQTCTNCGVVMGAYYCPVCVFFDDDLRKEIFHCDGCGICRVGGRDNFFHCDVCNACLGTALRDTHKCIQDVLKANCAVCQEDLFTSRASPVVMPCGHYLHKRCYKDLLSSGHFACPLCGKSAANLESEYRILDAEIARTPMPEDLRDLKVNVLCKDCQAKSEVAFHFYGLKCAACGSYNTART